MIQWISSWEKISFHISFEIVIFIYEQIHIGEKQTNKQKIMNQSLLCTSGLNSSTFFLEKKNIVKLLLGEIFTSEKIIILKIHYMFLR